MTTISAHVVEDSINSAGVRITTMHLRYPRFIHAELMTHRVFSRNARSSRAVPVSRMIDEVVNDPVIPLHWGKNEPGMQARSEHYQFVYLTDQLGETWEHTSQEAWLKARDATVAVAQAFAEAGYHKQVVNRLLEPFMHIDTLVTSTEWANWFALREHVDAEPHIARLAVQMREAMEGSTPVRLLNTDWHTPYIRPEDYLAVIDYLGSHLDEDKIQETIIKLSVARCARISYEPFDGNGSIEAELARYERLVGSKPLHASPAEHQARPDPMGAKPYLHGNFRGWIQFRKTLPHEALHDADLIPA